MAGGGGGVVHLPFYATGFRGDGLEAALAEIAALSTRYGATSYAVYRSRDDRYKLLLVVAFNSKLDWERYWDGDDFIDFRVRHQGWFQVPLLYSWNDLVTEGSMTPRSSEVASG